MVALSTLAVAALDGCASPVRHRPGWMATRSDLHRYMQQAVRDPDPDARREAALCITRTRYRNDPVAIKALSVAAQTDPNDSVRCTAVRALLDCDDDRAVMDVFLAVLEGSARHPQVVDAAPEVTWCVLEAARTLWESGQPCGESHVRLASICASLLETGPTRDVKIAAARTLALLHDVVSLRTLVSGLREEDFGVVYECHTTLVALTGKDHGLNADAWSAWLAASDAPLVRSSQETAAPEPKKRRWWRPDDWFR